MLAARRSPLALVQFRRDAAMLWRRLAGRTAPPLVRSLAASRGFPPVSQAASQAVAPRALGPALELVVARVVRETADACTLVLESPDGGAFSFLAGQFFTTLTELDGETVRRNYSASNASGGRELHLTIKEKPGGRVSGLLVRSRQGDRVRVLGPFGSFVLEARAEALPRRRLVLVAGGSGITPLMSIARTVLDTEPEAEISLVYGNRREADVILAAEIDALARAHAGRFLVAHVLEAREADAGGASAAWAQAAETGRLDRVTAARVFDAAPLASHPDTMFYVCGPDPMRDEVLAALATRGVAEEAVKVERFTIGPRPRATPASASLVAAAATAVPGGRPIAIRVKGATHRTTALPGATLLEAGLAAGAPMPFSCGVGGCGACRVRLVDGDVDVEEPSCLSAAERAAGYVLACVGRPSGPCTIEVLEGETP